MRLLLCLFIMLAASPAQAEDRRGSLTFAGIERTYFLHVPATMPAGPMPLVIALHGAGADGPSFAGETKLGAAAEAAGMLAVFPSGVQTTDGRGTWNAHFCCGTATTENIDDIGFIRSLIDALAAQFPIDRKRIYATGMSNGGMFAYQLAASQPWFAAIAPVSASIGGVGPNGQAFLIGLPPQPVPVMIMHGRKDPAVQFDGGAPSSARFRHWNTSVADAVSFWVSADGCKLSPETSSAADGKLERTAYRACKDGSEVVLWVSTEGGHWWPAEMAYPAPGGGTRSAAQEIVAFFAAHTLR